MRSSLPISLLSALLLPFAFAQQGGVGGGAPAPVPAATQFPVTNVGPSMFVVGGVTSVTYITFTQTFATTALGTWAFPTPLAGSIGLGGIQGTVGAVH